MTVLCEVCSTGSAKYKCPSCQLASCSLACSQRHKESCQGSSSEAVTNESHDAILHPNSRGVSQVNGFTDHLPPFSGLVHCLPLDALLTKYPMLRTQLLDIYKTTLPPGHSPEGDGGSPQTVHNARNLKNYGAGSGTSWTAEKGFDRALAQLRRLKGSGRYDNDGIREFAELVHMVCPMGKTDVPTAHS